MNLKAPIYFSTGLTEKANHYYKLFITWTNQKIRKTFVQRNMFEFKHIKAFDRAFADNPGPMVGGGIEGLGALLFHVIPNLGGKIILSILHPSIPSKNHPEHSPPHQSHLKTPHGQAISVKIKFLPVLISLKVKPPRKKLKFSMFVSCTHPGSKQDFLFHAILYCCFNSGWFIWYHKKKIIKFLY